MDAASRDTQPRTHTMGADARCSAASSASGARETCDLKSGTTLWSPHALVDAGGEPWDSLQGIVAQRMDDLQRGQVLEIVSVESDVPSTITEWCQGQGCRLLGILWRGGKTQLWLQK